MAAGSSCSGCPHVVASGATSRPTPSSRRPPPWIRHQRQDRAPGGSQTSAHPYHPGLAGRVVPPAYGRAPAPVLRRRRQVDCGRRPQAESWPLDQLYSVASRGRAGALPAVCAVRQPEHRGPLPSMTGGSRYSPNMKDVRSADVVATLTYQGHRTTNYEKLYRQVMGTTGLSGHHLPVTHTTDQGTPPTCHGH